MYVYKGNPRNMTVKLPNFGTTGAGLKAKKATKKPYKCKGGALDGQTLWLSSPLTMTMNIGGQIGYYQIVDPESKTIEWFDAQ